MRSLLQRDDSVLLKRSKRRSSKQQGTPSVAPSGIATASTMQNEPVETRRFSMKRQVSLSSLPTSFHDKSKSALVKDQLEQPRAPSFRKTPNRTKPMRNLLQRSDSMDLARVMTDSSGDESIQSASSSSGVHRPKSRSKRRERMTTSQQDNANNSSILSSSSRTSTSHNTCSEPLDSSSTHRQARRKLKKGARSMHALLQRADSVNLAAKKAKEHAGSDMTIPKSLERGSAHSTRSSDSSTGRPSQAKENSAVMANKARNLLRSTSVSNMNVNKTKKKKVRFDSNLSTVFAGCAANSGCLDDCWHSANEYLKFRGETIQQVAQVLASNNKTDGSSYPQVVVRLYLSCCRGPGTGSERGTRSTSSGSDDPTQQQEEDDQLVNKVVGDVDANQWHLGMEIIAAPAIQNDASTRRKQLLRIIGGVQNRKVGFMSADRKAEAIFRGVERVTRPARLFAHAIGKVVAKSAAPQVPATKDTVARGEDNIEVVSSQPVRPRRRSSRTRRLVEEDATVKDTQSPSKPQKKVSYDDSQVITIGSAVNKDATAECWYSRAEHFAFRQDANSEVEKLALSQEAVDLRYKGVVNGVYLACCRAGQSKTPGPTSEKSKEEKDSDDDRSSKTRVFTLPNGAKKVLNECLLESYNRLGLEMMALQCLREDNIHRRRYHKKRVLDIQKALRDLSSEERAEMIRTGVEPISLPSRLFARELASSRQSYH